MKIALILPSNLLYAPYLNYYTDILETEEIEYDIINWNRLGIKEETSRVYSYNRKSKLKSNIFKKIFDYYSFSKYIKKILDKNNYDKLIVFIPQLAVFLNNILKDKYKKQYILDIRDYGKANMYYRKLDQIIKNSNLTVISSEGYKEWLPTKYDYLISHNTSVKEYQLIQEQNKKDLKIKKEIVISNIGVIRNYYENKKVIDAFSNKDKYRLMYIGKGVCEDDLKKYCIDKNIQNVFFHGRYEKSEELNFYKESDIINLVMPVEGYGYKTAVANRLYNATITGCPVIVANGTYMSKIVEKYNLGIIIELDSDNIEEKVADYIKSFDYNEFINGCNIFLERIKYDQEVFEEKIKEFIYS